MTEKMKPGMRVVRGPDWNSKKQDNGEGFLGTIIFVPKKGSSDNKVTVIWDSGRELRYRAGHDGKCDLRVFDSAPAGIIHKHITCDECNDTPIKGMRWKCCVCVDFDLCTVCYMKGKHDLNHGFVRMEMDQSTAYPVPPRSKATKKATAKGVFPNAEVMRGPHWKYKNEDGGEGEVGKVVKLVTWNNNSYRGGVQIKWKSMSDIKTFRLGGEGCVDVIYTRVTENASGGNYYPEHLPRVDVVSPGTVPLKPGDKVTVNLSLDHLKTLQDNDLYGGWDDGKKQCVEETGTLLQLLYQDKTARVQYEDTQIWLLNRQALTLQHSFKEKEVVKILSSYNAVKDLQEGHGGWNDDMKSVIGKMGRIIKKDPDGDLRVKIEDNSWIFSPVCCQPVDDPKVSDKVPQLTASDEDTDDESMGGSVGSGMNAVAESIAQLFVDMLRGVPGVDQGKENIVQAAANGELAVVQAVLKANPDKVDQEVEGKSALQIACYYGHKDIVNFLLDKKANVNKTDLEGDTPVHYATFGKENAILDILLKNGAKKDVKNKKGQAAIHIAVGTASVECTKILVEHGCDVSIQDGDNDTAMHDAIVQTEGQPAILTAVLTAPTANFGTLNGKGFNVLQWATLKNNNQAVEVAVGRNKKIINDQMNQGFTALHVAAANDYVEICSILVTKGQADINALDDNKRTPLIVAVSQTHKRTVEFLITCACNVNVKDENGNTALHIAQLKQTLPKQLVQLMGVKQDEDVSTQIICRLIEAQADIYAKNNKGETPIDLAPDYMVKEFMKKLADQSKRPDTFGKTQRGIQIPSNWSQMDKTLQFQCFKLNMSNGMEQIEYKSIEQKFHKTLPQAKILQIERVQNMHLWEVYCLTRRNMEIRLGPGFVNEQELYHGTIPEIVENICIENFDFRLSGDRVGTLFGRGAYFAVESKYSDLYAKPDEKRHKYMFVAKVLAGKVSLGHSELKRPPPINPNDKHSHLYDACVDNVSNPRIYCVFDKNQYYPEYIIKYN